MRWDTAWMMASQPPLTLTPNCKGARTERAEDRTAWARHLDTRRRRTSPTAIGRRPPFFFLQASKEAPQKWGRIDCGVRPEASRLTNFVKAKRDNGTCQRRGTARLRGHGWNGGRRGLGRNRMERTSRFFLRLIRRLWEE